MGVGVMATTAVEAALPLRIAARQINELALPRVLRWQAATGMDRFGLLVFGVVGSANFAHLPLASPPGETPAWTGLEAPDRLRRPVRILSVAQSMGLPNETVRRRMHALEAAGLLAVSDEGCIVAPGVFTEARMGRVWREDGQALAATCRQMAEAGFALAAEAAPLAEDPARAPVVARLLQDFSTRIMETFIDTYGDLLDGTLVVGVITANVRHIGADPVLSRQYAEHDQPPPDTLRRPITTRALARELDLPHETVRRRAADLTARGAFHAVDGGLIVPAAILATDVYRRNNQKLLQWFTRMLRDLVALT